MVAPRRKFWSLINLIICTLVVAGFFGTSLITSSSTSNHHQTSPANMPTSTEQESEGIAAGLHVIVVGGGLAGLSAALTASAHGARVTLIDKEPKLGGNSAKATSGLNAVGTTAQSEAGVNDEETLFINDTLESGQGLSDPEMVRTLVSNSQKVVEWLSSFSLHLDAVVNAGGHRAARTHYEKPVDGKPRPVGWDIVSTLQKAAASDTKVTFLTGVRVIELLQDTTGYTPDLPRGSLPVIGVRYVSTSKPAADGNTAAASQAAAPVDLLADAVVLATGEEHPLL